MDQGLFKKHILSLESRITAKQELCSIIESVTSVPFTEEEFTLSQKKVTLHVSSVKKSFLLQKGLQKILQQKGYTLVF